MKSKNPQILLSTTATDTTLPCQLITLNVWSGSSASTTSVINSISLSTFFNKNENIDRRLPDLGTNHIYETAHPSVKRRLEQIFNNADVNIPELGTVGDGDPIDPNPFPEPCIDDDGNTLIKCPSEDIQ